MKRRIKGLMAVCAMLVASSTAGALAGDFGNNTDWTVKIKTETLDGYMKGTNYSPVEKVNISFYKGAEQTKPTGYQKFYFHDGKPIGLERQGQFIEDKEGGNVTFLVTHKSAAGSKGEMKAAAGSVLRILLDAHNSKIQLATIKVPAASLQSMSNEMVTRHHCEVLPNDDVEKPVYAAFTMLLSTESGAQEVHLAYKNK